MKNNHYQPMSLKEERQFSRYLVDIRKACRFFQQHFVGKEMIYKTETMEVSVLFHKSHFMHLCGVTYKDGASAFFRVLEQEKASLNLSKISIKKDFTTFQKLPLLSFIDKLITGDVSLSNGAVFLNLTFDYALKAKRNKYAFALTLKDEGEGAFPISLIDTTKKSNFPAGQKIIEIKSIDLETKEEIVHFSASGETSSETNPC